MAGLKRVASVPREARILDVSKSDLLEAAWELASLANDAGSCDDAESTLRHLVETINGARSRRGARPLTIANHVTARAKETK